MMLNRAVTESRREPPDALDFFPTPPWATRALIEHVLGANTVECLTCWDPCAGEGHMAEPLKAYFSRVHASDVFDYGAGYPVGSFTGGFDRIAAPADHIDWLIYNPPFNDAAAFLVRALEVAQVGVAMLARTSWLETQGRYQDVYSQHPPRLVAIFAERVPMHKGRWEPDGGSMTSYAWFVWGNRPRTTQLMWIPPGQRQALEHPEDRARFAGTKNDETQEEMFA